ncbi:S8 family serine peptidase [Dactylosporangium sp. NPDC000244]|uniref:S8 family serine peptidase n=1 Tax=Dactylosporangium sp. NPDC000244 TaxID=3154365 RepID=UPI003325E37E
MAMPQRRRRGLTACLLILSIAALALTAAGPAAARAPSDEFVKYYVVAAARTGGTETLYQIAERLLGSTSRFTEIMDRNQGRRQPDGGALSDPARLTPGWALVLPWDAYGDGVRVGLLPTTMPAATQSPAPRATTGPSAPATASAPPTPAGSGPPATASGSACQATGATASGPDWVGSRIAVTEAWTRTKGEGTTVAVVDSGVDASLTRLGEHVVDGADIVTGAAGGNDDCLGSGTAMASLILAKQVDGGGMYGVAPDATVMPIRLIGSGGDPAPTDQAVAIDVAVTTGARVIALGAYVDPEAPDVARAIANATDHDVVVVVGAPVGAAATAAGEARPGVLRVAAVGPDGRRAADYRAGAVDVAAPGVEVQYLGPTGTGTRRGTGTQYAVAVVAGQAALVRSAHPKLSAAQVADRIRSTAEQPSGLINVAASVARDLPAPSVAGAPPGDSSGGSGGTLLVVLMVVVAVAAVALVLVRVRGMVRGRAAARDRADGDADAHPIEAPAPVPEVHHGRG